MYKNRCHMPFILYPPDMYDIDDAEGGNVVIKSLDLESKGTDFIMYLSIPYCRVCCKACPYFIELLSAKKDKKEQVLTHYINALVLDLKRSAATYRWRNSRLRGVYIGGGTGSLLEINHLDKILSTLEENFNLSIDCEITLEGNATDFDKQKSLYISKSIINRISLGAQSFQTEILKTIGAPHKAHKTIETIHMLQDSGINNIQLDIMYNIPGHTLSLWEKDLKVISKLGIKHLTTYLYRVTPGTRQELLINMGKTPQVMSAEHNIVKEMQAMIKQFASQTGMHNYMFEHYALPGYESKYNHWTMKECVDVLGLGPGAYSFINQRRTGICKNVDKYIKNVLGDKQTFTTASNPLTPKISKQRYIIFNLLYYKINKQHYRTFWKKECYEDFKKIIDILIVEKSIKETATDFVVTESGKEYLQNMMLEFFDDDMWENSKALLQQQSSWAMNNHMIEIGSSKKEFWLARK